MDWICVKDRLPNPGVRVLVTTGNFVGEAWLHDDCRWKRYNGMDMEEILAPVTYWMMLPEPRPDPAGQNDDGIRASEKGGLNDES